MTDRIELECAMLRAGKNKKDVAMYLGITYNGLMKKIRNLSYFTAPEISRIQDFLGLSTEQRNAIFFADDVAK